MAKNSTSGNPATQAQRDLTIKQQREQKKQEKLAEYQRQVAKRRRTGMMWWIVGGVATLVIVGMVIASFVFAPPPAPQFQANNSTGLEIDGVETFENETQHVEGTVDYEQNPPAGGPHNQYWLNCGVYDQPQQKEFAVHSLEHGAIWVTYDPSVIQGESLDELKAQLPSTYVVLSPFEGMDTPIALSGWNHQLKLESPTDERIAQFFTEYWRSQNVPEPNASCTGAIDGEGKQ